MTVATGTPDAFGQLGDLQESVCVHLLDAHPMNLAPSAAAFGPAAAPDSISAATSSSAKPASPSTSAVCSPSAGAGRVASPGVRSRA